MIPRRLELRARRNPSAAVAVGVALAAFIVWLSLTIGSDLGDRSERAARAQWLRAATAPGDRQLPFGDAVFPKWIKSMFARRRAGLEPACRYPIDESPLGVHDLAGSLAELVRREPGDGDSPNVLGGDYQHAFRDQRNPERSSRAAASMIGFRLVAFPVD